jgi:hypothetical protein
MGRSGTTILQRLCNAHPQMRVTDEFGNYAFLGDTVPRYAARTVARVQTIGGRWRILGPPGYLSSRFPHDIRFRSRNHAANVRACANHLFRLARRRPDRVTLDDLVEADGRGTQVIRIVGDKLPSYALMLDRLVPLPQLLRLVIYRDCRDVTSSFLRKVRTDWKRQSWTRYVDTAEKVARRWVRAIEDLEKHAGDLYVVRYEELVADPRSVLNRLARWLEVEPGGFERDMVSASSVGKHMQGLTTRELDEVLEVAGPTMKRLNYFQPGAVGPEPGMSFS